MPFRIITDSVTDMVISVRISLIVGLLVCVGVYAPASVPPIPTIDQIHLPSPGATCEDYEATSSALRVISWREEINKALDGLATAEFSKLDIEGLKECALAPLNLKDLDTMVRDACKTLPLDNAIRQSMKRYADTCGILFKKN